MGKSILDGVDNLLRSQFGAYTTKTGAKEYLKKPNNLSDILWEKIYEQISLNYQNGNDAHSTENWRFEIKPFKAPKNKSAEKLLEKAIAKLGEKGTEWANQVPVASGLVSSGRDRKRSVDLIRKQGVGSYEFIELKIASNNPLYAAIEILEYGIVYILYRIVIPENMRGAKSCPDLLRARKIHLIVSAPESYYEGYNRNSIISLGKNLSKTINAFAKKRIKNLDMDFYFERFKFDELMADLYLESREPLKNL